MKLLIGVMATFGLMALAAAPREAIAEILIAESFEYPNGELQQASGYVWLKHSGDSGGQSILNQTLFIDDDGTNDYSRALGDFPPIRSGSVFAAFDLKVSTLDPPENSSASAPYFMHFSEEFGGGTPQIVSRLVMNPGTVSNSFRLGIARGGGSLATTTPWGPNLACGISYRIVVGYDLDADISTLWINPASAASTHVTNATGIGLPILGLNWLCFRIDGTNGRSGDKWIDNLAVATSFSELFSTQSPATLGDFDGDGDADGADFVTWQTHFPATSDMTAATGDADNDGDVDGADFVVWQTNFSSSLSAGTTSVPEPPAILIAAIATVAVQSRRKRTSMTSQNLSAANTTCFVLSQTRFRRSSGS
jgi:hypothetical protein